MDAQGFIKIMKLYESLKNKLKENINNSFMTLSSGDYYLIEDDFLNELEIKIINYNKDKFTKKINLSKLLPDKNPEIIKNFSDLINCLKNNKSIRLISKELIELINNKLILNNNYYVQYFSGNGKIIIEYKNNNKNALLLINPYNRSTLKDNIFIIINNNNQQKSLYEELLSKSNNLFQNQINNKNIIPLNKYDNKKPINNNNLINNNNNLDFKKDLLKIAILLFYYEKSLSENIENIFSVRQYYYLIEPNWINKYKEYYNFLKFDEMINKFHKNNPKINYSNLDKHINNIINFFIDKNNLDFDKKELSKELTENKSISHFLILKFNIKFIKIAMIVPSKIMDLILKWNKNIVISPKEILYKEKNIYYFNKPNIIIGNLNRINLFIPKYIFSYKLKEIYDSEKKILIFNKVDEYITMRKCSDIFVNELQILKNENNEEIGNFIIYLNNNRKNTEEKVKLLNKSRPQSKKKFIRINKSLANGNAKNITIDSSIYSTKTQQKLKHVLLGENLSSLLFVRQ